MIGKDRTAEFCYMLSKQPVLFFCAKDAHLTATRTARSIGEA